MKMTDAEVFAFLIPSVTVFVVYGIKLVRMYRKIMSREKVELND